jgi:hypothetical protein
MIGSSLFSRRNVLVFFGAAAASFGLGYALRRLTAPPGSPPINWRAAFEAKSGEGEAVVKSLVGEGYAGARKLALGAMVPSGQHLRVAKDGVMVLAMPDRTVMKIVGEAELELHIDPRSGGVYNLALGAILTVVPTRNLYLAMGPTATIGVKGTVFFREVSGGKPRMMQSMEGPVPMPEGITDYFCTCNGEVEYLGDLQRGEIVRSDRAKHHNSFYLKGSGAQYELVKAPMLDHFDDEIDRLIDIQEPPRHDKSWLQLAAASRPGGTR